VLDTGNASTIAALSPRNKAHAMAAIAALSKYTGQYEQWLAIRRRYNLKWTKGDSLQAMERFFNPALSLESMLSKVKEMIRVLPANMAAIIKFAVLTGLRPVEACESVRLLNAPLSPNGEQIGRAETLSSFEERAHQLVSSYYNAEQQCLEHFRHPDIFLRATKKAYISYLSRDNYHYFANLGPKSPTWSMISYACKRKGVNMDMRLCRKIFASWLIQAGVDSNSVDMLQGRCPVSVLARHYQSPPQNLKDRVLNATASLQQQMENI
jgi:Archaeal phage integrase